MQENNPYLVLPDVTVAPYLLQYFFEIGLCKSTGMGLVPVDWVDLLAWVNLTGTDLRPEEVRILHGLSSTYVMQANKSKEQNCPAPYPIIDQQTPDKVDKVKAQMAVIKQRRSKRD